MASSGIFNSCHDCTEDCDELRALPCGHVLCYMCVVKAVNQQTKKIKDGTGSMPKVRSLPCPICKNTVWLTGSGIGALPLYNTIGDSLYTVASTSQGGSEQTTSTSQGGATGGQLQLKEEKLLWNFIDHKHIWDVAFMDDGSVYYIAAKTLKEEKGATYFVNKKLYRLGTDGKPLPLPFPFLIDDPKSVACDVTTKSVAVCYYSDQDDQYSVSIYSHVSGQWSCRQFHTNRVMERIAFSSCGGVLGVRPKGMLKLDRSGRKEWYRGLATTNAVPYVTVGQHDRIIVSTEDTDYHNIHVWSKEGDVLNEFPSGFVHKPTGVCTDSRGNVIVADLMEHSVSMLTTGGKFVQTLIKCGAEPRSISLYNDTFLAVATWNNGLYFYELSWQ